MNKNWILYASTLIVGGMLLYELYAGIAIVMGTRRITRRDNPFRYWFWILFHAAALAALIFAWVIGIDLN
jgi:hypothetical protein